MWVHARGVLLLFTMVACRSELNVSEAQRKGIADTVVSLLNAHLDAMKRFDIDSALTFFAQTPEFVYADNGDVVGWDGFAARTRAFPSTFAEVLAIKLGTPHVQVLARNAASLTVTFDESFRRTSGDTIQMRGQWTVVFQRFAGGWKIVQVGGAHVSADDPRKVGS